MAHWIWAVAGAGLSWALAYREANRWIWAVCAAVYLLAASFASAFSFVTLAILGTFYIAACAIVLVPRLRRAFVSDPLFGWFRRVMPQVSTTEKEALNAGTVWWDADLFSGRPDWNKLLAFPRPALSKEERDFLDGPVEELCAMTDDWEATYELNDLPPSVWQFIKDEGFLGMIIPKEYGGLGFSAYAHSQVITKLATRSAPATVAVMVPNSLGPSELLLHYGTDEQKHYYLPRLARGLETPCFALTGPDAGSDAGAIPDHGIVCYGTHEGRQVLGMRLTWDKRYITLGPVATLLGLAFRLYDPNRFLGQEQDLGITLALVPTGHPGVNIGRRHFPLNASFMNGPNSGKDVFIPMEWVIGGQERVGQGWRMLMECLAAGRSISLPSSSAGMAQMAARTTGAYARIRQQFRVPIGKFEGVEEAMARIGGNTYMIDAVRTLTAGAVDLGEKPSVLSAVAKYHCTERGRTVINDAMDVHGGKGICLGPNNYLGRAYQQAPIAITVEGANILTRSMIIFGQGAIRAHPYVLKEIDAAGYADETTGARLFDQALWSHGAFLAGNAARSLFLGLGGARLKPVPGSRDLKRHFQNLSRICAGFAFMADLSMLALGGALKRREKLSGRLGDMLSYMYLGSAVLKRFEDEGQQQTDLPFARWALEECCYRAQEAAYGVFDNFPNRVIAALMKRVAFPFGRRFKAPSDDLGQRVTRLIMQASPARERLTADVYFASSEADPVGRLELALGAVAAAEAVEAKARSKGKVHRAMPASMSEQVDVALSANTISAEEAQLWRRYEQLRKACIMVDDFPQDVGRRTTPREQNKPDRTAEQRGMPEKAEA
ncbi:MAG: acyl-CoA dehydrogenase [Betaproteobacteria bacterium]|nr:acyl-CoA dehydrogenase [Betaproteobacteria bacterium]